MTVAFNSIIGACSAIFIIYWLIRAQWTKKGKAFGPPWHIEFRWDAIIFCSRIFMDYAALSGLGSIGGALPGRCSGLYD